VVLERGPLSLVSTTEELFDRKVAASVKKTENTTVGICHADLVAPSVGMVRVLGYSSGGPGSIPGTTRKKSSGSGTGSTQPREYN
jgi:hypothetical protein